MTWTTADLCDASPDTVAVAAPLFRDFGGVSAFAGPVQTVRVFEDNVLVRQQLEQPGDGRVLVVDGGGSLRRALLGDKLAALAIDHGWVGVVVHGCIRDAAVIATLSLGVKALHTSPRKSDKSGAGEVATTVEFAGIRLDPGHYLYADADGIVVSPHALTD